MPVCMCMWVLNLNKQTGSAVSASVIREYDEERLSAHTVLGTLIVDPQVCLTPCASVAWFYIIITRVQD